jgi:3D (Asp-Asp-Asp) domain-containing protein
MIKLVLVFFVLLINPTVLHRQLVDYDIVLPQKTINVRITNYYASVGDKTASNSVIRKSSFNKWVAISRQLKKILNLDFGDTISISEPLQLKGEYIIKDLTNKRIKNTIDILTKPTDEANLYFGKIKIDI